MTNGSIIKIGGEFEINPSSLKGVSDFNPNKATFLFSSGRSALMAILKNVARTNPRKIHIPYYICQSVVNACIYADFNVSFYELDERFLFPLDYTEKIEKEEVLLTVNYFGFVDDNPTVESIKQTRPDIVTISDHSQSFWTYSQSMADYSFTSLRKYLPVPDGAFVNSMKKDLLDRNNTIFKNSFYSLKLAGSIMKWQKQDDNLYLELFSEGENIIDTEHSITQASFVSEFLFSTINLEALKKKRKKNTQTIYELGSKAGLEFVFAYDETVIPLAVPVLLNNRDKIRQAMMYERIFLPIHWPIRLYNTKSRLAKQMSSKSLSLVVDHRYGDNEMSFEVNVLSNLIR